MDEGTSPPSVGIFWGVLDGSAPNRALVINATPLSHAEPYGAALTHPHGDYEVWKAWQGHDGFLEGTARPGTMSDQGPRGPTWRRLLALLATAPVFVSANTPTFPKGDADYDPISRIFVQFKQTVAAHERAQARSTGLRQRSSRGFDFRGCVFRHRLTHLRSTRPTPTPSASICGVDSPHVYSSTSFEGDRGLGEAGRTVRSRRFSPFEDSIARAIHVVDDLLLAQPAHGLQAWRLKLIVLLAVYRPGDTRNELESWHSLGSVLGDVTNLIAADARG